MLFPTRNAMQKIKYRNAYELDTMPVVRAYAHIFLFLLFLQLHVPIRSMPGTQLQPTAQLRQHKQAC